MRNGKDKYKIPRNKYYKKTFSTNISNKFSLIAKRSKIFAHKKLTTARFFLIFISPSSVSSSQSTNEFRLEACSKEKRWRNDSNLEDDGIASKTADNGVVVIKLQKDANKVLQSESASERNFLKTFFRGSGHISGECAARQA